MIKRSISYLLVILILFGIVFTTSVTTAAKNSEAKQELAGTGYETSGDFQYRCRSDVLGLVTAEITKYTGSSSAVVIPSSINGFEVTHIGEKAFYCNETIKSVTLPSSAAVIAESSFFGCKGLKNITFSESLKTIWTSSFGACTSIESITIPDSVTYIGQNAFSGCSNLKNVVIGNGITQIDYYVFRNCSSLRSITIGSGVKGIEKSAFSGCNCLQSITISSDNPFLDSRNNCNAVIETDSNNLIFGCQSTIIPESVTSIGKNAFSDCASLENIFIPDSVTSIGYGAFQKCTGIKRIVIPNSVSTLGNSAFYGCSNLMEVILSNSVTDLGDSTFSNCTSLEKITLNNSIKGIGDSTFKNCSSLKSINIPDSVKRIDKEAFYNCTNLESITHGASLLSVGQYAFYKTAWYNMQPEREIIYIGRVALGYKNKLSCPTEIELKQGTIGIADYAFDNIDNLQSVILTDSIICIGKYAFSWCTSLSSIVIPNSVTNVGEHAFSGCNSLLDAVIGASVTSISEEMFYGCDSLMSITINKSVTLIDNSAFGCCNELKDVYYAGDQFEWSQIEIIEGNEALSNAAIHFNSVTEPNTSSYSWISEDGSNRIVIGETKDFFVHENNGQSGLVDFYISDVLSWETSDSSIISIVSSEEQFSRVKLKAQKHGKSDISLLVNGKKVYTFTVYADISDNEMLKNYGAYLTDNRCLSVLNNAQQVSENVIKRYSASDRFGIITLTMIDGGLGTKTAAKQVMADMGFGKDMYDQAACDVATSILSDYYNSQDYFGKEFLDETKPWWTYLKSYAKLVSSNKKTEGQAKEEAAELLANTVGEKTEDIFDYFESFSKAAKVTDYVADVYKYAGTALMMAKFEKDTVKKIMKKLPKDSLAYSGFASIYRDLGDNILEYTVKNFTTQTITDGIADIMSDCVKAYVPVFGVTATIAKIITTILKQLGAVDADSYLQADYARIMSRDLLNILPTQKDTKSLTLILDITVSATKTALENAKSLCKYKNLKTYTSQIDSFLIKLDSINYNTYMNQSRAELQKSLVISGYTYSDENGNSAVEIYYRSPEKQSSEIAATGASDNEDRIYAIPAQMYGKPIVRVAEEGFLEVSEIEEVSMPDTVKEIGSRAFSNCPDLCSVVTGRRLTTIGESAFSGCAKLQNISLPDSVITIGNNAFTGCSSLQYITIGANVQKIADNTFSNCTSLESVYFSGFDTEVKDNAFDGVPDSLTIFGFYGSKAMLFAEAHGYDFVVIGQDVDSISIKTLPSSTTVKRGEELSADGLSLNVSYRHGSTATITNGFFVSCFTEEPGNQIASVYFGGCIATFAVEVVDNYDKAVCVKEDNLLLNAGSVYVPDIRITPEEVCSQEYTAVSDNEKVVIIQDGMIYAKTKGEANIIINAQEGVSKTIHVSVDNVLNGTLTQDGMSRLIPLTFVDNSSHSFVLQSKTPFTISLYSEGGEPVDSSSTGGSGRAVINADIPAGKTYFIFIDSPNSIDDDYTLTVDPFTILGDVDSDGGVTIIDATFIQRKLANIPIPFVFKDTLADADKDGSVTIIDATYIQRWLVNLPTNNSIGKPIS